MTPIMWAAWKGKTAVVELFISSSAKLDRQEKWGRTALILAADEGHAEVVGDTIR
jgi:ankyrin repeat protein